MQLDFVLTNYDIIVKYASHYTTRTHLNPVCNLIIIAFVTKISQGRWLLNAKSDFPVSISKTVAVILGRSPKKMTWLGLVMLFGTSTLVSYLKSNLVYIYIYVYMCVCIRGAFNKFPDIFVWAYKILAHSWKFSMLLLYILWDDWPISASNEQLQQQLEYTLLKPDCHGWWISKM